MRTATSRCTLIETSRPIQGTTNRILLRLTRASKKASLYNCSENVKKGNSSSKNSQKNGLSRPTVYKIKKSIKKYTEASFEEDLEEQVEVNLRDYDTL